MKRKDTENKYEPLRQYATGVAGSIPNACMEYVIDLILPTAPRSLFPLCV